MATRKYKITYVVHIIFVLNSKYCSRTGASQNGLKPDFVNKVLLDHSHTVCGGIVCGHLPAIRTKLRSCDRHRVAAEPKIFTILPLTERGLGVAPTPPL